MINRTALTFVALAIVVAFSSALYAQTLREGTWPGTVILPDGSSNDVTFDVKTDGGRLSITYNSAQGAIPLEDVQLDGDTLSYGFSIGGVADITCELTRQDDGSYTGECDAGGQTGRHTLRPPND